MHKYNFQKNPLKKNQNDETLPNLHKKNAPKKGREKETKGKDQSPSKQTAQKRLATGR
jgi:hypothetical protein